MSEPDREKALWRGHHEGVAPEDILARSLVAQQTDISHEKIPRISLVPLLRTAQLPRSTAP
jgi:hypothetical protein